MAERRCGTCREVFDRPAGSNRLHCPVCRPPRVRPNVRAEVEEDVVPARASVAVPGPVVQSTVEAVREELVRVKAADSVAGRVALRLAQVLDDPGLGAAQVSSISAQLLRTMEPLTKRGPRAADVTSEFERALAEKRRSA